MIPSELHPAAPTRVAPGTADFEGEDEREKAICEFTESILEGRDVYTAELTFRSFHKVLAVAAWTVGSNKGPLLGEPGG